MMSEPAPEELANLTEATRRGDFIAAFDHADRLCDAHPDSLACEYQTVLALARAGAPDGARRRYEDRRLKERSEGAEAQLRVDILALDGRLWKDDAFRRSGADRAVALRRAALAYAAVADATHDGFPAVNAATLFVLAGDDARAQHYAVLAVEGAARMGDPFWAASTRAEAFVTLGRDDAAREAIADAAAASGGDQARAAATRRQLTQLLEARGWSAHMLEPLAAPATIHFTGRRFREGGAEEAALRAQVDGYLAEYRVGFGFGSLAAGADIVAAEALIARGADVTLVMPFEEREFVARSVAPLGAGWVPRFQRTFDAVKGRGGVHFATRDQYLGDDILFGYAARYAMGLARLRAQAVFGPVRQLAMWDGGPGSRDAGTFADVATWVEAGGVSDRFHVAGSAGEPGPAVAPSGRVPRALLFGDIKGFSRLREAQLPVFMEHVMGALGAAIRASGAAVEFANTWGDGVYVVLSNAAAAAECALAMQRRIDAIAFESLGLNTGMGLRLGAHFGPVLPYDDPILGHRGFVGEHVSRTARIEPVAPEGATYVTECFAAELALTAEKTYACRYAGNIPAAKDYGSMRMYALERI